ncbi:esterase-like activity of phytase family protein [Amycolatopsis panacis]|uniref:Esterase-like activity of phytase family protein n=1 Tax=Amycolatopsis panacis TaxID=2340917 RepID=A0A419I8A6_9PSEU|nr:hypothetical protein [Amycolatopsis panacis]RJQ88302.1 hypothetical protein D5S19_08045 [Amycolatopsis panacis]
MVLALLVFGALPASAAQVPAPETVCRVTDPRLDELSGLVSDGEHWYAINDGGTQVQVFVLDRSCRVRQVRTDPADPFDVEDLARAADGTLWLSDTGDNRHQRSTVALLELKPSGGPVVLHRLTYPDGAHDGEALLLDRSGVPYLVTKDVLGDAKVYRPAGPLTTPGPTALEQVGTLRVHSTDTPGGPIGAFGSVLVTGGATSADGTVVALRTYTDAYLYPAPDGDVAAALRRDPVRIPLPDEKQGEAIAFDPDGTLLSASEGTGQPVRALRNAAALVSPQPSGSPSAAAPAGAESGAAESGAAQDDGGVPILPAAGIAVAVVLAGWFLLSRLRRR